jgi:hypothetical protein
MTSRALKAGFLPKFEVNGVFNHTTGNVVAALLGQQGSLQLSEGLGARVDDGFQSLAAVAPRYPAVPHAGGGRRLAVPLPSPRPRSTAAASEPKQGMGWLYV